MGYLFGFTKLGADRTKQSHWAAAIEFGIQQAIEPEQFLGAIETNGDIYAMAKCLKEARRTIAQRVEELEKAQADEDAYLAENVSVAIEPAGTLKNLAEGYHTINIRSHEDGTVEYLYRLDESTAASQKRFRKAIQPNKAPKPTKPVPQHRHPHKGSSRPIKLAANHQAIIKSETLHPALRRKPNCAENVLKEGKNSRKLGSVISVGRWKEFPIFSLTLEERATCPLGCPMLQNCYGNGMSQPRAWRYEHGTELLCQLELEIKEKSLAPETSNGFAIRIHTLGDFYSVEYVEWWAQQFAAYPALHGWSYAARQKDSPIGRALQKVAEAYPNQFSLRWSNTGGVQNGTKVVDPNTTDITRISERICPAQTGIKADCGSCSFCWESSNPIVFLEH